LGTVQASHLHFILTMNQDLVRFGVIPACAGI